MFKIFIADGLSSTVIDFIKRQKDCEVEVEIGLSEEKLIEKIPEFDALIVRSATTVTAKIITAGKKLKLIGRAGAGTDNIDKVAASAAGILVVNAPTGNLTSVAELVFGHFLSAFRQLPAANETTKAGFWKKKELGKKGREIDGKTLGIIGLGKIGQLVAQRAKGFNLKILAFDPVITAEIAENVGAKLVDIEQLLRDSDLITLHIPLIPQTKNLIAEDQFKIMKPDAMIVNCARGGVIDEDALAQWLQQNPPALAAIDTFAEEPVAKTNQLLKIDNFFTTPHIGASTIEAQEKVGMQLADQVVRALRGEIVEYIVNFPTRGGSGLKDQKIWNETAEQLARIAAQLLEGKPLEKAELIIAGEISKADTKMPQLSVLKGLLEALTDERDVNFTNIKDLAEKRGLKLLLKEQKEAEDFHNQLKLKLTTSEEIIEVHGTVIEGEPRVTFVQDFKTNFIPSKHLLFTRHRDQPGVIGRIGTLLGENKINIASMDLGRNKIGEDALMILNIDNLLPDDILHEIKKWDDFKQAIRVDL